MTEPLRIGPLRVGTPVVLAPMAGVTDAPFRRLCRLFGEDGMGGSAVLDDASLEKGVDAPAGLFVTEMITSRGLVQGAGRTREMIRPDPAERVRSVQLYGVDPQIMGQAARMLVDADVADHIDLNFGCPVPKVTRKGGGAALPWKSTLFAAIIDEVVRAAREAGDARGVEIPVTIKMRIGIDDDHETFMDAARAAEDLGVAAIALHARTQAEYYSGRAHWDAIARLKQAVDVPVLGNGDVFDADDAREMLERTGCDAVVVGRGCQGRPWIFRDLAAAMHGRPAPAAPTLREVADIICTHAQWEVEDRGDEFKAMRDMRKHVGWYLRGFAVGGETRRHLNLVSTVDELRSRLDDLDLDQPFPEAAEGARGRKGEAKAPHLPDGWLDSRELTDQERSQLHLAELGVSGG